MGHAASEALITAPRRRRPDTRVALLADADTPHVSPRRLAPAARYITHTCRLAGWHQRPTARGHGCTVSSSRRWNATSDTCAWRRFIRRPFVMGRHRGGCPPLTPTTTLVRRPAPFPSRHLSPATLSRACPPHSRAASSPRTARRILSVRPPRSAPGPRTTPGPSARQPRASSPASLTRPPLPLGTVARAALPLTLGPARQAPTRTPDHRAKPGNANVWHRVRPASAH